MPPRIHLGVLPGLFSLAHWFRDNVVPQENPTAVRMASAPRRVVWQGTRGPLCQCGICSLCTLGLLGGVWVHWVAALARDCMTVHCLHFALAIRPHEVKRSLRWVFIVHAIQDPVCTMFAYVKGVYASPHCGRHLPQGLKRSQPFYLKSSKVTLSTMVTRQPNLGSQLYTGVAKDLQL